MSAVAHYADSSRTFPEVREVPIVLQKSPSGLCEIEICNYRIGAPVLLNRCCAFQPDLESIFLAEMLKILLQQNRPPRRSPTPALDPHNPARASSRDECIKEARAEGGPPFCGRQKRKAPPGSSSPGRRFRLGVRAQKKARE